MRPSCARPGAARLTLAAAGLAVLGLVGSASGAAPVAGPRSLTITDVSGDALPGTSGDLLKVVYTTTGTTSVKKVGKKSVATYTPKNLVVTITTKDPIDLSGTTTYEADATLDGCTGFNLYFTPGVDGSEGGGCTNSSGATDFTSVGVDGPPAVAGSTITWTIPFKAVPGVLKQGAVLSGFDTYTGLVEPLTGITGPYLLGFPNDDVTSDATYKVG